MAIKQVQLGSLKPGKVFSFINGKVHPQYGKSLYVVRETDPLTGDTTYYKRNCDGKFPDNVLTSAAIVEIMVRDDAPAPNKVETRTAKPPFEQLSRGGCPMPRRSFLSKKADLEPDF